MKLSSPATTLCLLALSTPLAAQNPISFPQDSLNTTIGDANPLGFTRFPTSAECRFQQLIPAQYVPSSGNVFTALEVFASSGSGAINYQSLQITLGHTTNASLNTTFSANLTNATTVFNQTKVPVTYTTGVWTRFTFSTPFVHDGRSNLTVEIQKVVDPTLQPVRNLAHGTTANPPRNDLPKTLAATGILNSGASSSATGSNTGTPLKIRLVGTRPTLTVGSDRSGLSSQVFALGGNVDLTNHGVASSKFANAISVGFGTPVPVFGGLIHLNQPALLLSTGTIGAGGSTLRKLTIPNIVSLVGTHVTLQGLHDSGGQLVLTNATDFIVNS